MSSSDKLKVPYEELLSATNNFAKTNKIGEGGFGGVYLAKSKQHGLVAIKRLNSNSSQGIHEYGTEINLLSKYKHENLVSLVGICKERDEMILVYKYEANQSLDKVLHRKDLSWMRRLHICLGAARGLMYLHSHTQPGSNLGVIHCDIKSSNILLDKNWNAKISDFGLSKLAPTNSADSVIYTRARGTRGYIDRKILDGYGFTQKSDVFSFGVVLFEVLFGKLVGGGRFTVNMAKQHYKKNTLHNMIDSLIREEMNSDSLSTFSTIAYQCVKKRREVRPSMSIVVEALEKALGYQQASIRGLYGGNLKIPLQEIKSATNNFAEANIIGIGEFGTMYRGDSEQRGMLAIKRLNGVHREQGDNQYEMKVTLLSKYKHENLASLVGFCGEDNEQILVYKYEEPSLDKFLHSKDLSWMLRLRICLGAARGLRYLHNETGSQHGVIHHNIKSSNILLDENWNSKISNFGLCKIPLTNMAISVILTGACALAQQSDVYSFGVVLYEVLIGKRIAITEYLDDRLFTIEKARKHHEEKTLHNMIDSHLREEMNSDSLSTFSTIAYQCVKKRIEDRPTMSSVVEALEKALDYQQASTRGLYSGNLKIPLQEIKSATNKFAEANIIGIGEFGTMYRGDSEQHGMLAIKRLHSVHHKLGDNQYEMKVTLLSKYKHENLASFVGFCGEDNEQILVYKYEAKPSLDKFLHSKDLSWMLRLHICLGAARGLRYLHNETVTQHGVIHHNIKTSNILLDENWNAKISNFGLCKIPHTNTAISVVLTGACALAQKSDVYSFGVVLYEVLFGKLVVVPRYLDDRRFTIEKAIKYHEENTLHMMIDPDLRNEMGSDSLSTFSTIAYQCLNKQTKYRPTMSMVVEALEKALAYQQATSMTRVSV